MRDQGPSRCSTAPGRESRELREQILDVMALEGIRAARRRRRHHDRLAARARTRREAVHRPGRRRPRRGPQLRHGARRLPVVPGGGRPRRRWTTTGSSPRRCASTSRASRPAARRIKFLYTIPNFHNPAGVTLTGQRRPEILEIARAERHPRARGQPLRPAVLRRAGAARAALARRGRRHLPRLLLEDAGARASASAGRSRRTPSARSSSSANESAILSPSSFSQPVISEYLASADWRGQIDTFRGVYRERKDAMIEALGEYLPELTLDEPERRLLRLGHHARAARLEADAAARRQGARRVHPGHGVLRRRRRAPHDAAVVLLSDARGIRVGVRRLATVVNGELDLLDTFAGTGTLQLAVSTQLRYRRSAS